MFTAADCIQRFLSINYEFMKIVLMKYLSFCELSGICSLIEAKKQGFCTVSVRCVSMWPIMACFLIE